MSSFFNNEEIRNLCLIHGTYNDALWQCIARWNQRMKDNQKQKEDLNGTYTLPECCYRN
jgi:hypothetical protein